MNTREFKQGEDGRYRWQYDMDMVRNKSIVWIVFKILGICMAGLWMLMTFLFAKDGGFFPHMFLIMTLIFIGVTAAFFALTYLIYVIMAKIKGGTYVLRYEMDGDGVSIVQSRRTTERNKAMGTAVVAGALATGKLAGAGPAAAMMLSEEIAHTYFANVRRVIEMRKYDLIEIHEVVGANQIYAAPEIYDQVLAFIRAHVK